MYDHVGLWVTDLDTTVRFYAALLGREPAHADPGLVEWEDLAFSPVQKGRAVTTGVHLGVKASSRAEVDRRWQAARALGSESLGDPGPRPQRTPSSYGGLLRDPDGNAVEVVHLDEMREDEGDIDHMWLRVADADASRAFYDTIAPAAGLRLVHHERGAWVDYARQGASLRLLTSDEPTVPLHFAFKADSREPVQAFHRAATEAGYRDNGRPGERPQYHPGYYGAFVLDPDGHNVEVVFHDR